MYNSWYMKLLSRLLDDFATIRFGIWVVFFALVGMALALAIGLQQSIWFDEAYSILVARQDVAEILRLSAIDTHPPGYYLTLHYWAGVFGWSDVSLRMLSIMAYGSSIAVSGLLVRKMFGSKAALTAMVVVAVSPFLIRYGFEIRMYALGSFIGILATYVLLKARDSSGNAARSYWALYALLVAVGVYVIYYLALLWIAHLIWLLAQAVLAHRLTKLHREPWLYAYVGSVVLFLPWLWVFLQQVGNGALAPIGKAMNLEQLLGIVTFNTVYQPVWQLGVAVSLLVLAMLGMFAWAIPKVYKSLRKQQRLYLLLLASYSLVPIVALVVVSFFKEMYVERYLAHVAIGLMSLLAVILYKSWSVSLRAAQLLTMVFVVAIAVGLWQLSQVGNFNFQRMEKPTVATVAQHIGECNFDTMILAQGPYEAIELMAYYPECPVWFHSPDEELRGGYAPLSGSSYQIRATSIVGFSNTIAYVHYGEPIIEIDDRYQVSESKLEGALRITTYKLVSED